MFALIFFSVQNNVLRKLPVSLALLQEKMDNIRGAVIMGNITRIHVICASINIYVLLM